MKQIQIQPIFKWFDLWIGLFFDKSKLWLYILPIPMCGIIIKFLPDKYILTVEYEIWPAETKEDPNATEKIRFYTIKKYSRTICSKMTLKQAIKETWKDYYKNLKLQNDRGRY